MPPRLALDDARMPRVGAANALAVFPLPSAAPPPSLLLLVALSTAMASEDCIGDDDADDDDVDELLNEGVYTRS